MPGGDRGARPGDDDQTQVWSAESPTTWNPVAGAGDGRAEPPQRKWELSDTGHSIPPYPSLPEPTHPPRRGRQGLVLAMLVALLIAGVVAFLGFVTPGFFLIRVLDATAVQTGVQKVLTNDYGLTGVEQVTCGAGNRVTTGTTFTCQAIVNGQQYTVPVRVTTDAGDYEVGRPTPG